MDERVYLPWYHPI